jgi:hypothetical protein
VAGALLAAPGDAGAVFLAVVPTATGSTYFCDTCAPPGDNQVLGVGRFYQPNTGAPMDYVAALEFSLAEVPRSATINAAYLFIGAILEGTMGTVELASYFGNGTIERSDFTANFSANFALDGAAIQPYDVTGDVAGYRRIGGTHIGFQAKQDPRGVCAAPEPQPTAPQYGHCYTILYGPGLEQRPGPVLFVDYTPFVDPPVDPPAPVPEPQTWALLIGGFGLAGAAMRRRRSSLSRAA